MKTEDMRSGHVEMQPMTVSPLHVFRETTLDHRKEAMVEAKVLILLETAYHKVFEGKRCLFTKLLRSMYAESSLEPPPIRLYTWR